MPAPSQTNEIWKKESPDQLVRVFQRGGEKLLVLNDQSSVQSIFKPGSYLTYDYWDAPIVLWPREMYPSRVLILGNGGGTSARAIRHFYPKTNIDTVETDPAVNYAAKRFFGFKEDNRLHLFEKDARRFIQESDSKYGLIFSDVYDSSFIPFQFATYEFFEEIKKRLRQDGILIVNVNYSGNKKLFSSIAATAKSVFKYGYYYSFSSSNRVLVLSDTKFSKEFISKTGKISLKKINSTGGVFSDDKSKIELLFPF